jgi:hypothetical protein
MEKISWTDRVKNEEEEYRTYDKKEEGQLDWSHLRWNGLLKQVTEGKIEVRVEVTGRRERSKQLLDDLKKTRKYCEFEEEEALDSTVWRNPLEEVKDL